jgi:hypothetical protein
MKRKRLWQFLILIGLMLAFTTLMMVGTHIRARRTVESFTAQLAARGEKLRIDDLAPSPLPASNAVWEFTGAASRLAVTDPNLEPVLMHCVKPGRALVAWKHAVLSREDTSNAWPRLEPAWSNAAVSPAALRAALEKPLLVWDLDYAKALDLQFPQLGPVRRCGRTLAMSAVWELHRGNAEAAWADLETMSTLLQRYRGEPLILCQLTRCGMAGTGVAAMWEALQYPGWSEAQLAAWQKTWSAIDLFEPMEAALSMEIALTGPIFDQLRQSRVRFGAVIGWRDSAGPNSEGELVLLGELREALLKLHARTLGYWSWKWWNSYAEELCAIQMWYAGVLAVRRARAEQAWQPARQQLEDTLKQVAHSFAKASNDFKLRDEYDGSQVRRLLDRVAAAESQRRLLTAALALERYRVRHGRYPGDLPALAPEFVPEVPRDFIDGQPLRYQLKGTNAFLLYSVGADGEDNGGDASPEDQEKSLRPWSGRDWVWPAPASPGEAIRARRRE